MYFNSKQLVFFLHFVGPHLSSCWQLHNLPSVHCADTGKWKNCNVLLYVIPDTVGCRLSSVGCKELTPSSSCSVPYLPWEPLPCKGGSYSSVLNHWLSFPAVLQNWHRGRQNICECLKNRRNALALLSCWNSPATPGRGWKLIQPRCSTWREK